MATELHAARLDTIADFVIASGARTVLDLGCGPGEFTQRLQAHAQFEKIVGIDIDPRVLAQALEKFSNDARIHIKPGSFAEFDPSLVGFEAAALVETIEHVNPDRLPQVEQAVFAGMRPKRVFVSTPNREFNVVHGMKPGQKRHPDHRFEWDRARFKAWARGVASRNGYGVYFVDVGDRHPELGSSTQMAVFERELH